MSQAEIVYLDPNDTFAAIRERLSAAEADHIVLVVPEGCPGLDGVVDLRLLARYSVVVDKEVSLVIRNRELRELARGLGFRTFSSTAWARRAKWSPRRKGKKGKGGDPLSRTVGARSVARPATSRGSALGGLLVLALAFAGMLALMGLLVLVFVPQATVTLHPNIYPIRTSLSVEGTPNLESIDFISARVPAKVVEIEVVGSSQIATTAVRDEPDARAIGEVVFTNKRSEATTVVSDTVVTTSAGTTVKFRTTDVVVLPAGVGSRGRAPVEAIDPGLGGNVPAYSINRVEGPMDRQVNVINVTPTEGGGMSQVRHVTNADKEQLRELALHQLKEDGYNQLVAQLSEEEVLPRESLQGFVLSETYDKFPGEVGESLNLHMRALVRGTVVDREDVELLGLRMLQLELREGFQLLSGETEVRIEETTGVQYDGTLTFSMAAEGLSWVEIDELEIKEAVRGKPVADAEAHLVRHLSLATVPTVEVLPAWWDRVSWLPFRITVHVASATGVAE